MNKRVMRTAKFVGMGLLGILLAGLAAAAYAPHLPALLAEGYPSVAWPARGHHVLVSGSDQPESSNTYHQVRPANARLRRLFNESGGRALLAYHKGRVALELTRAGADIEIKFNSFSLVKSLIGALVLKAVDEGKIANLDASLSTALPELHGRSIGAVTIRQLLEMRSGILFESDALKSASGFAEKDLEGAIANPFGPMAQLHARGLGEILGQLASKPQDRDRFSYQNVNTAILGAVLEKVYGVSLAKLLEDKIWRLSGAGPAHWRRHGANGPVSAYCCLYARAIDWALAARFIANNGQANAEFLSPRLWRMLLGHDLAQQALSAGHYGLHVRHDVLDRPGEPLQGRFTYFLGQGGQIVYLMPAQDLIVVRFGERAQLLHSTLYSVWKSITTGGRQAVITP
ncbi:MAG: serine hydrolase [Hyphomicrobiaceae bacterium]